MERPLALVAVLIVGGLIALQPPVNSQLARETSILGAAFISTSISALLMGGLFFAAGGTSQLSSLPSVPPIYLTGGILGAVLVSVSLVAVRTLGAGGVVAATVCTQLIVSAVLDRFGILGLDEIGFTPLRMAGFALLLTGTLMVTIR